MSSERQDTQSGNSVAEEVRCKRFVVEDAQGNVACEIGAGQDGAMRLALFDPQGNMRVVAGISPEGTAEISVTGAGDGPAVSLCANVTETSLFMYDAHQNKRVELVVSAQGNTGINMLHTNGEVAAFLNVVDAHPRLAGILLDGTVAFATPASRPTEREERLT